MSRGLGDVYKRQADQYRFPGQLCATADYGLLKDAAAAAERLGIRADVGQVFTSDREGKPCVYLAKTAGAAAKGE